jgi:glycosidase
MLLFTMPGLPSIYYGSEWGIEGKKQPRSDRSLRPEIDLEAMNRRHQGTSLIESIRRFAAVRRSSPGLAHGDYRSLHVASEQLAFSRRHGAETIVVAVNAASRAYTLAFALDAPCTRLVDVTDHHTAIAVHGSSVSLPMAPSSGRILRAER